MYIYVVEHHNVKSSLQIFPSQWKTSHRDDQHDYRDSEVMVELISKKQQQQRLTLPDLRNVAFHDMVIANKLFEERRVDKIIEVYVYTFVFINSLP